MAPLKVFRHTLYGLFILLVLPSCTESPTPPASSFFEKLLVGGVIGGKIYLEVPLKETFFANAKSWQEQADVWSEFFKKAILEPGYKETSQDAQSETLYGAPYWGSNVIRNIDVKYIRSSTELQIGDIFKVRTPYEYGSAKIVSYEIHESVSAGGNLLLAVAEPLNGFTPADTRLLVANRSLSECQQSCASRRLSPDSKIGARILDKMSNEASNPEHNPATESIILEGHFTRRDATQYVAYVRFGEYIDSKWRTVILDSDLKIISLLGENEYEHIKPLVVGDIDNDGLDEIWTELQGYEGQHFGIWYWRGGSGKDAFRAIATTYDGV
jgi:hypothetical protein